ncbi:MAG TPA: chalcone isomerase family protein [Thiobacillaceae bacterium]|nr:chalcone isomerase family protein [Thiobacillaceae bacterium]
MSTPRPGAAGPAVRGRIGLAVLGLAACLLALPAWAAEVGGVRFEDRARVGEADLALNGAGVRAVFVIKVYALGLYLPKPSRDAVQAIAMPGPKRLRLATLREVEAERFLDGLGKGLAKNHGEPELAALKARTDQFAAQVQAASPLPKGAVLNLDLLPGGSTRVSLNGHALGPDIPGEDFFQALLRIWLGTKPAQDDLKAALLGG